MEAAGAAALEFAYRVDRGGFALDAAATLALSGITGIFGRSGAGKTTLLRCIAGLDRAAEGRLVVGGDTWEDGAERLRLPPDKRAIGYVFQEPRLFPHLDVRQNLEYGIRRRAGAPAVAFDTVVGLLGLAALLDRRPAGLSGGEAQRVAIGRAVLRAPRVLLMDEPVAALDAEHRQEILPFIRRLHTGSGIPVLYVTHSIEELCQLCDQLVLVDAGRVRASGELQPLLARTDLPLLGGEQAGVIIDAAVASADDGDGLAVLEAAAGRLYVPRTAVNGNRARIRVRASDVSLCRQAPGATSILNRLPVTVQKVTEESPHAVLVHLDAAGDTLLARITRRSARELGLAPGAELIAQIKAVSVRPARA
ncbi:MAG TPA: molybdenum ABC transporter ATP-binding protein [Woeseiaceae bacterium]|nr:molybdenum ABC transporter ATP-binding protein [Woeseiaceae bacterium]